MHASAQIHTPRPPMKFVVHVRTDEDEHFYSGLFESSCDATTDAKEKFPDATRIRVRRAANDKN